MNLCIYNYITAFEVGLCAHKKLLCLVIHIYRYCNVSTMASSAIVLFPFSVNDNGGILLHSWSPIKLLMLRQCNVTRASYNYDPQSNGSCGHHFFHIKTRSSAEHSKIANRERSKRFSIVFQQDLLSCFPMSDMVPGGTKWSFHLFS